jgi:hypothetical protein
MDFTMILYTDFEIWFQYMNWFSMIFWSCTGLISFDQAIFTASLGDYQMESNVKHEFILLEWKENSRGNPYGQPHLVLFGSQNYHLCSMQYEMIDYHRTVARQGPTKSRFTMIYVTLCNYACLCQCFHVFFEEICQHGFPPTSPTSPP